MDDRIESALDYIEKNLGRNIRLSELSKRVYLSPYHLHRLFKAETGVALKKFIDMMKMEKAYQQTLKGNKKLKDLSASLGYQDYETFSRAFKRYHGVTPDILRTVSVELQKQIADLQDRGNVIVVTNETSDVGQIREKIKNKLTESGFTISDTTQIKTYVVQRVDDTHSGSKNIIRNKYALEKGGKVWQTLLHKLKTKDKK